MWTKLVENTLLTTCIILFSANTLAGTINGSGTVDPVAPPGFGSIVEILSNGTGGLTLNNDGLIILDSNVYNSSLSLNIDSLTTIFTSLSTLPSGTIIPDFENINTLAFIGDLTLDGTTIDFVLIRNFNNITALNLSSSVGVLVIDSASLTSVPIPNALFLLFSGLLAVITLANKKI